MATELERRVEAAKKINSMFNVERYTYIACCGISVLMLFADAFLLLAQRTSANGIPYAELSTLFGAGGLITFSIGRLLYMWDRIVNLVFAEVVGTGGGKNGK